MNHGDPAEYQSASYTPDMAEEIDSLEDLLREVAASELPKITAEARGMILPVVTTVARKGIERALASGLLHNENTATFTPKFKEILVRILSEVHASTNPRLYIDCLSFAFGLSLRQGLSLTSIAEEHGVTRACPSKMAVQICEQYSIPPSRGMKTEAARETFSKRQVGKTAKPRAEEWTRGGKLKAAFGAAARA